MSSDDEHANDRPDQSDEQGGLSRREVMRRGAVIGGAAMWAVPTVQTIGMRGASAGTPKNPCTGFAYNVFLDANGLVDGEVGPLNHSPEDQDYEKDCIVDLTADVDGNGNNEVVVGLACVENDFGDTCCTRSVLTETVVDLTDLGIDVQLNAETIKAEACASCDDPDHPTATSELANASIVVLGTRTELDASPGPNTNVANLSVAGLLNVSLVLNEQKSIPGGIEVNAVHLYVELLDTLGEVVQSADLILGHAQADVHGC